MNHRLIIPFLFFVVACSGEIDEPVAPEPAGPDLCADVAVEPGPAVARRLTNGEFVHTVQDVLGVDLSSRASGLPRESYVDGFRNTAWALSVSPAHIDAYRRLAADVARELEASPGSLETFGFCEGGCEDVFVAQLGERLFRRPATEDEVRRFGRLFDVARAEGEGALRGALLVVQAMLVSPQFLYRLETSREDEVLPARVVHPDGGNPILVSVATPHQLTWELEAGDYRVEARLRSTDGIVDGAMVVDGERLRSWEISSTGATYTSPLTIGAGQGALTFAIVFDGSDDLLSEPKTLLIEELTLVGPMPTAVTVDADAAPDAVRAVRGYEMASRLSYFLWHSAPDKALLDAAAEGTLDTLEGLEQTAARMLESPRARRAFRNYVGEWLVFDDLGTAERDYELFPEFGEALVADMKEETYRFLEAIAWDAHRDWLSLFTAKQTYLSPRLAHLYDLPVHGEGWKAFDFSDHRGHPGERAGLLTQASFLTSTVYNDETSPVRRGHVVRQHFMCQTVPDPATNAVMEAPGATEGLSQRERLKVHSENAQCSFCHRLMDPIGLGFESYDAIGAYRTHDIHGNPVSDEGAVVEGRTSQEFKGAAQLGMLLAESPEVEQCLVEQVFQYAMGRPVMEADQCQIEALLKAFHTRGRSYRDLILALVTSDAFRHVRAQ